MERYLRVLRFIPQPFEDRGFTIVQKDPSIESLSPELLVESIVSTCLAELGIEEIDLEFRNEKFLEVFTPTTVEAPVSATWKLSYIILEILNQLKIELERIEKLKSQSMAKEQPELLSLGDQMYIQKCIEILIGFGLLPYLLVGTFDCDIQQKSTHFKVSESEVFISSDRTLSDLEKFSRLEHTLKKVMEITQNPTLFTLIFPRYLNEFLAAYIQETQLPLARPRDGTPFGASCEKLSHSQFNYVHAGREFFMEEIPQLFERIPKKNVVISVLIVGGSGARHIWIQRACTTILFEIMTSPYGFLTTCQAIYEDLGGSAVNDCDIWRVTRVISSLLRSSFYTCFSINAENEKFKILKPELPPGRSLLLSDPASILTELCRQCVTMISASPEMNKSQSDAAGCDQNKNKNENETVNVLVEDSHSQDSDSDGDGDNKLSSENMSYIGIVSVFTMMEFDPLLIREIVFATIFGPILNLSQVQASENQVICSRVDQLVHCVRIAQDLLVTRISLDISYSAEFSVNPMSFVQIPLLEEDYFQTIWSTIYMLYTTTFKYLNRDIEDQEREIRKKCTKLLNACSDVILVLELSPGNVSALAQSFSLLFLNQVWKITSMDERSYDFLYWLNEFKLEFALTNVLRTDLDEVFIEPVVYIERGLVDKDVNGFTDTIGLLTCDINILCYVFLQNDRVGQFSSQLLMESCSYKQECDGRDDIQVEEIHRIQASMVQVKSTTPIWRNDDSGEESYANDSEYSDYETDYENEYEIELEILENFRRNQNENEILENLGMNQNEILENLRLNQNENEILENLRMNQNENENEILENLRMNQNENENENENEILDNLRMNEMNQNMNMNQQDQEQEPNFDIDSNSICEDKEKDKDVNNNMDNNTENTDNMDNNIDRRSIIRSISRSRSLSYGEGSTWFNENFSQSMSSRSSISSTSSIPHIPIILDDWILRLMNKYRNFVATKLYQDLDRAEAEAEYRARAWAEHRARARARTRAEETETEGEESYEDCTDSDSDDYTTDTDDYSDEDSVGVLDDTLAFLEQVMKRFVNEAESISQNQNIEIGGGEDQQQEQFPFSESLILSLGVLDTFMQSLCKDQQDILDGYPITEATLFPDPGPVWEKLDSSFVPILEAFEYTNDPKLVEKGVPEKIKSFLYIIQSGINLHLSLSSSDEEEEEYQEPRPSRWEIAMYNLKSRLQHIKGHGLLEMRRLIDENDPIAHLPENLEMLVELFEREMMSDDSYVYLMSIYGLASLGNAFPQFVVPVLCNEYAYTVRTFNDPDQAGYDCEGMLEDMNFRVKVGEVMVEVVGNLGEDLALDFREKVIDTFFHVVRDEDPLIRASALSNMGELCHILKLNLGMVLTEIWKLVTDIFKVEKVLIVRRAAIHLIVMCLRGVTRDFDQEMSDYLMKNVEIGQYLRDVRRFLLELRQTERDCVAILHIQLALDELDRIALLLIATQNSVEFKFRIMQLCTRKP